jgi:hypothetical protein
MSKFYLAFFVKYTYRKIGQKKQADTRIDYYEPKAHGKESLS